MAKTKGYGQFCPVAKAAELVAERWTFLVIRELLLGSRRFNELKRGVPLMSPSLLSQRLKEMQRAGIVRKIAGDGPKSTQYVLTDAGEQLRPIVEGLGVWGLRWAHDRITREDLDPGLLMWDMRRGIRAEHLPAGRSVIEFDFGAREKKKRMWWLVVTDGEVDLCLVYPGYDADLTVSCDLRTMTDVWLRRTSVQAAVRGGSIQLEGRRDLVRDFPKWLGQSAVVTAEARSVI